MRFGVLVAAFLCLALPARAEPASPDDTARFLAGMPLAAGSPLSSLSGAAWQQHARSFDAAFGKVDANQLSKVRAWSSATITLRKPVLYYFFSGPDFLYANSFYPDAATYVMCGLEPPGAIPDINKMPKGAVPGALGALRVSLSSILGRSFFKTRDMRDELHASSLTGTLPVLYVFLARSGKTIQDVSLVQLGEAGEVLPEGKPVRPGAAQGAKITFASPGGPTQTLYYFSANLANGGFDKSGLKPLAERLGEGNALVKSASYLLHDGEFSKVRSFLLERNASILQDDTGVPLALFDKSWRFRQFGHYLAPIPLFPGKYQPKMAELYRVGPRAPLSFGIGYRWRPNESNLLLATKQDVAPPSPPVATVAKPRADAEDAMSLRFTRQ